jgi:hypothetical protein
MLWNICFCSERNDLKDRVMYYFFLLIHLILINLSYFLFYFYKIILVS